LTRIAGIGIEPSSSCLFFDPFAIFHPEAVVPSSRICLLRGGLVVVLTLISAVGFAQPRVRFSNPATAGTTGGAGGLPAPNGPATATLGQGIQPFDAYSTVSQPSPSAGGGSAPLYNPPPAAPNYNAPAASGWRSPTAPAYGAQAPPALPSGPPAVFPQGGYGQPYGQTYGQPGGWCGPTWTPPPFPYERFFQNTGLRYTWLAGGSGRELDINDIEFFTTATFPNFVYSTAPLLVTPGFILHLWDGPQDMAPSELPANAYSAYLDFAWRPGIIDQRLSADLGIRFGVYSDFNSLNTSSIRIQGLGLGVIQLTPTLAVKLGVVYLDRVKVKLLPAGGLLWTPNPQTKFDIFFPQPKLSQYLTDLGNVEVWWYVGGEYGGGSWTVETISPGGVDINDIRVFGGLEWSHPNKLTGFIEVGYVFDREVVYRDLGVANFKPTDTIMLRAGFNF